MFKEKIFLENFKISIFKSSGFVYLYIYNINYYCLIKFTKNIKIELKTNKFLEFNSNNRDTKSLKNIKYFLNQFYFYKFTKIKFTGKGYKIKKNSSKSLILLFNRAHTTTLWWKNLSIKKIKKYKMYLKYNHLQKNIVNTILNVRYINIFTKKGLRESRQIILKKKGKK
jgi:hypothetical protein